MSVQWNYKKQMLGRNGCLDARQKNILKYPYYKKYAHPNMRNVPFFIYNFCVWCENFVLTPRVFWEQLQKN